jgi:hypothetical protein
MILPRRAALGILQFAKIFAAGLNTARTEGYILPNTARTRLMYIEICKNFLTEIFILSALHCSAESLLLRGRSDGRISLQFYVGVALGILQFAKKGRRTDKINYFRTDG